MFSYIIIMNCSSFANFCVLPVFCFLLVFFWFVFVFVFCLWRAICCSYFQFLCCIYCFVFLHSPLCHQCSLCLQIFHSWFPFRFSLTFIQLLEDGDVLKSLNVKCKLECTVRVVKYKLHTMSLLVYYYQGVANNL